MPGPLTTFLRGAVPQDRLPRPIRIAVGLACVAAGAVLTLRPFTSLSVLVVLVAVTAVVTGVGELAAAAQSAAPRPHLLAGAIWVLAGVAVAAWPGLSIAGIAVWVGVAMVAVGLLRLLGAFAGPRDRAPLDVRATDALIGVAEIVLGVLALAWPDVTVLVVAVTFGIRTVLFGLTLVWTAIRARREGPREKPGFLRRSVRLVGAIAALVVALALGSVSIALHRGNPTVDAFYDAPSRVPSAPGALLRSEPYTTGVPAGARAWRILYTTYDTGHRPAVASGIVLVSRTAPAGPRPVIAWAHGTTGFARRCAPSVLKDPFAAGALPALSQIIAKGWVLVATDYTGLGTRGVHPYLIGPGEAYSVLDAVRAARHLGGVHLADRTVVWGHSQGGNAALWTGQLAPTYAPEDNVVGVAALAPASDLKALAGNLNTVPGGALFASYIVAAYTGTYPAVRFTDYIRPAARQLVRGYAQRCLAEPEVFVSIATSLLADKPIFSTPPTQGAFGVRLADNSPKGTIQAPVFLGQGRADQLVLPSVQDAYAALRCTLGGGPLEYRTYAGRDHVAVVANDSPLIPDLVRWTEDRFAGRPATSTCR